MVGQDLAGQRVLDAFGGSGLLAFEAWSRGAEVVVVERNGRAATAIRQGAEALGADGVTVRRGDVLRLAADLDPFDGALVDPPYKLPVGPILEALAPVVRHWLVLEADVRTDVPDRAGRLARERVRQYGGTAIHLFFEEA